VLVVREGVTLERCRENALVRKIVYCRAITDFHESCLRVLEVVVGHVVVDLKPVQLHLLPPNKGVILEGIVADDICAADHVQASGLLFLLVLLQQDIGLVVFEGVAED
jgi:hypothetical protein